MCMYWYIYFFLAKTTLRVCKPMMHVGYVAVLGLCAIEFGIVRLQDRVDRMVQCSQLQIHASRQLGKLKQNDKGSYY